MSTLHFVHIGKCGGGTLHRILPKCNLKYTRIERTHAASPAPYRPGQDYLINIRNPLKRTISAWHWRKKILAESPEQRAYRWKELKVYEKYSEIDHLAEALYDGDELNEAVYKDYMTIGHLYNGIEFHMRNIIDKLRKEQVFAVMLQETLNDDIAKYLNFENTLQQHKNNSSKKPPISELSKENLLKVIKPEYEMVERMNDLGILTPEKYEILTKQ